MVCTIHATVAQQELTELAKRVARECDGKPGWRTRPKDRQRAMDKIKADYERDASRLTDLAGAKVEFQKLTDLYAALDRLIKEPGVRIVRFKDRFQKPQDSGYRDVQLCLRLSNGHVGEFRLHLAAMDETIGGSMRSMRFGGISRRMLIWRAGS